MALTEFLTTDRALASVLNDKVVTPVNAYITANDAEVSKLKKFQNAGGTGTAITLTGVELTDGFNLTFIATANNSAAATTINGKPLYKPGTTTAPNVKSGKAITVWYNLAGDCFFLKASAEGNAVVGDVLAGKTFSNDDDTGLIGTYSNIKSIQRGMKLMDAVSNTTVSISAVDVSKSILLIFVATPSGLNINEVSVSSVLSSSSISFNAGVSVYNKYISWQVIEFNNVKSKQSGSLSNPTMDGTLVTVSEIDIGKSIAVCSMRTTSNASQYAKDITHSVEIVDSTHIKIRSTDFSTTTVVWQVIEFN